jgi:hypothetical protein
MPGFFTPREEDTMKRLIAVSAVILILACEDQAPFQPDLVGDPELALAQAAGGQGDLVKAVPFKMKGTWWPTAVGDASPCIPYPGAIPRFLEWRATSAHMGLVAGFATNCIVIQPDGSYLLLLHATRTVAANGDLLYARGSAADDATVLLVHPDLSFEIWPAPIVGGTGRFENAEGEYHLYGDHLFGGAFTMEGWISSVGSSK